MLEQALRHFRMVVIVNFREMAFSNCDGSRRDHLLRGIQDLCLLGLRLEAFLKS